MSGLRCLAVVPWLLVAGLPMALVPGPGGGPPNAIDASGTSDVTAALQQLLDDTPDGGVVRLEPGGDYRVDGTLLLEDRHDLEIDGRGARIFATSTGGEHRTHLRIVGGARLVVRDLRIVGANPHAGLADRAYQPHLVGQHGIRLEGPTDVEISAVQVADTYGDFVYVGRREDGRWSEGVWIHDSVFARSGRQGITVTAGRDVVIERNVISDTRRATIDLEPNSPSWGAENIHILDNVVGRGRLLFVAAAGRGPVDQVVVARNRLQGHILNVVVEPPPGDRRAGFWIVDNSSDEAATRSPMRFTSVDGLVVTGNTQPVTRAGEAAVAVTDACGVTVDGNHLAPGSIEVLGAAGCGEPLPLQPPAAPLVAGRPAAVTTTTTTLAPPAAPATTATPAPETGGRGGPRGPGLWVLVAGVTGGAVLVAAVAVVSGRRPASRAGRRTAPPSPPR